MFRLRSRWHISPLAAVLVLATVFPAIAADLERAAPESVGISAARLDRIGAILQVYIDQKLLPGAVVAVARQNKLVYLKSFGSMDAESNQAMREDAIFRIASMTKPITSTAVMMLYEEGKLLLSDAISKYIPEFEKPQVLVTSNPDSTDYTTVPARREITILDLLSHTSGITYRFWNKKPIAGLYEQAGIADGLVPPPGTVGETVRRLAKLPLVNQPGEAYEYGLNSDVLAPVTK